MGYFTSGLLCGLVTLPVASVTDGLMEAFTSYRIAFSDILLSTIPVLIISIVVALGLWLKRGFIIKCFQTLRGVVTSLLSLILAIAAFEEIIGVVIPFFSVMAKRDEAGLTGLDRGLLVAGEVSIVLSGAFVFMRFINVHFGVSIRKAGKNWGLMKYHQWAS